MVEQPNDQPDEDASDPRAALDSLMEDLVLKPFLPLVEEARQLKVPGLASFVADMASAIDNSEPEEMAKAYDDLAKAVAETKAPPLSAPWVRAKHCTNRLVAILMLLSAACGAALSWVLR
jgi:hypothetical protein